jgi:hypothetical protein
MKTNLKLAPKRAAGPKLISQQYLLKQLQRFPRRSRRAITIVAMRHPALLDLAASFPALLYACTFLGRGEHRASLCAQVIKGTPLRDLARAAVVPWWTRRFSPEALGEALALLPSSDFTERHILNFIPEKSRDLQRWLELVSFAQKVSGESFALWVARNFKHCKHANTLELRSLGIWAWYSMRGNSFAGNLVLRKWAPAISWRQAKDARDCWFDTLELFLYMGDRQVHYAVQTTDSWEEYRFLPLTSAVEIFNEFQNMDNCMRTYGDSVYRQNMRLVSVQKDGKSVALLALYDGKGQRRLSIEQLQGPKNSTVSQSIAQAVRCWLLQQDPFLFDTVIGPFMSGKSWPIWRRIWKEYWLEAERPEWLPLTPKDDEFGDLRWNY